MIGVVLADALVWAGWGTFVGWAASRIPAARLQADRGPLRLASGERARWERLGVRRWKDRMPEAGAVFGGRSKRRLPATGRTGLAEFAVETRRAELVHWVVPLAVVVFPLWNPWWLTLVMVGYAIVANAPCIVIQRYNRARIGGMVARCS